MLQINLLKLINKYLLANLCGLFLLSKHSADIIFKNHRPQLVIQ